jgi:hypothetical protein
MRPPLYLGLAFKGRGAVFTLFGIGNAHYFVRAGVVPARTRFMFSKTPFYVSRNTRVIRTVSALQDVDEVHDEKIFDKDYLIW